MAAAMFDNSLVLAGDWSAATSLRSRHPLIPVNDETGRGSILALKFFGGLNMRALSNRDSIAWMVFLAIVVVVASYFVPTPISSTSEDVYRITVTPDR